MNRLYIEFIQFIFTNFIRNFIFVGFFSILLVIALIYFVPQRFSSTIVFAPSEEESSVGLDSSGLAGIASMAGVDLGSGSNKTQSIHNLELLKSRNVLKVFLIDNTKLEILAPKYWDNSTNQLIKDLSLSELHAIIYKDYFSFSEDRRKNIIKFSVTSHNKEISSRIANEFLDFGNDLLRQKTITENDNFFNALSKEFSDIDSITLKQGISSKIASKLFSTSIAKSKEDFAFEILDPAIPNPRPIPSKFMLGVLALSVTLILRLLILLFQFRNKKS